MPYTKTIICIVTFFSVICVSTTRTYANDKDCIQEHSAQKDAGSQKEYPLASEKEDGTDQDESTTGGWFRKTIRDSARQMRSDYDAIIQAGKNVGAGATDVGKGVKKTAIESYDDARKELTHSR